MLRKFSSVALSCLLLSCEAASSAAAQGAATSNVDNDSGSASIQNAEHLVRYLKHSKRQDTKKEAAAAEAAASLSQNSVAVDDENAAATSNNVLDAITRRNDKVAERRKKKAMREGDAKNVRFAGSGKASKVTPSPTSYHPMTKAPSAASTGHPTMHMGKSGKGTKSTLSPTFNPTLYTTLDPTVSPTREYPTSDEPTIIEPTFVPTGTKSAKGAKSAKGVKSGKAVITHSPTSDSTLSPTYLPTPDPDPTFSPTTFMPTPYNTIFPTSLPPGATFFDSFETATFPSGPWSVSTADDMDDQVGLWSRRLEEEEQTSLYWELTTEEAYTGIYSIKTPDLSDDYYFSDDPYVRRTANATLVTGQEWDMVGPGILAFSVLASLKEDALFWFVDDVIKDLVLGGSGEWEPYEIYLGPGSHHVTWEYSHWDDDPTGGVAFIDDVFFRPTATLIPTFAPSTPLPTYPTDPTFSPTDLPFGIPTQSPMLSPTAYPTDLTPTTKIPSYEPTLFPSLSPTAFFWEQRGQDIDGTEKYDEAGGSVSMSDDGLTVAVGLPGHNNDSGQVRIFNLVDSVWSQLGEGIDCANYEKKLGMPVVLSADGKAVAIGSPSYNAMGEESGLVSVHKWENDSQWSLIGSEIVGSEGDQFGRSVSLSKSGYNMYLAVGAPGNGPGHVRLYYFEEGHELNKWLQVGEPIVGETNGDQFGRSLSCSVGCTAIAIGAPSKNQGVGQTKVYSLQDGDTWKEAGQPIDGESSDELSGLSVDLSADGKTLAIGAPFNSDNGMNAGHVKVYKLLPILPQPRWRQAGQTITGEDRDYYGEAMALSSDGGSLAIGAKFHNENRGRTRVFKFLESNVWEQHGNSIDGEKGGDWSGFAVALSAYGRDLVIGAPLNNGSGPSDSGHVRGFKVSIEDESLELYHWGGSFGVGSSDIRWWTEPTPSGFRVVQMSAGSYYSMYVLEDKTVKIAGFIDSLDNYRGHLGLRGSEISEGAAIPPTVLTRVFDEENEQHIDAPPFVMAFAGVEHPSSPGSMHSLLMDVDGHVWATGSNSKGQLCLGDYNDRLTPQKIPIDGTVISAAIGAEHTLLLLEDGSVYGCGSNEAGQLGLGEDVPIMEVPTLVEGLGVVESLSVGLDFSLFKSDDGLHVTGSNLYGQLCIDTEGANAMTPIKVYLNENDDVDASTVSAFEAIKTSSFLLFKDGSVVACGRNNFGQLGIGTNEDSTRSFIESFSDGVLIRKLGVGPSSESVFFVDEDKNVYATGLNNVGQLGVGFLGNRNVPTGVGSSDTDNFELLKISASGGHTLGML